MPRSTRYRSSLALIVGAGLISLILWYTSLQNESREHLNSSVWRTLWPCEQGSIGDSKWDCIDRDRASRHTVDVELQKQQLDDLVAERKIWTNNRAQYQNADNLEYARKCLEEPGSCPSRPLIVSHYLYVELLKAGDPLGGEMVWMESVIEKLEAMGYRLLILRQYHEVVQAARMAGSLIHSYWGDERFVTECVGDPRCIADYQPPYVTTEDEPLPSLPSGLASTEGEQEHWVNLDGKENWEKVPLEERGSLPVQRLFSVQFWPNAPLEQHRADDYQGPGREMAAPNPLGNQWTMTPFPYPGHLFMPWSVEQACHRTPNVPQSERQPRAAIIFAKYTSLFHWHTDPKAWSSEPFVESGIKFYATAKTHPDGELPAGIQNLGPLTTDVYSATVAGMRAMIGIGAPKFSPSPYFALCKGVPVVLWRSDDREPRNEWERLLPGLSQHGPVASLGKPYVYEYTGNNVTQLLDAVEQAVSNPIEPYIPPVMRDQYVAEHIAAWAETDFEDRLNSWIREHMGRKPRATLMYREKFGLL